MEVPDSRIKAMRTIISIMQMKISALNRNLGYTREEKGKIVEQVLTLLSILEEGILQLTGYIDWGENGEKIILKPIPEGDPFGDFFDGIGNFLINEDAQSDPQDQEKPS